MKLKGKHFALKNKGKHLIYVLDHLGEVDGEKTNIRIETDQAMSAMKSFCKDYDATSIVLSQLSKAVIDEKNRINSFRPNASHVMESVGVQAKSDVMILLWRPEIYFDYVSYDGNPSWTTAGKLVPIVVKNRDGQAPYDIVMGHQIQYNKFFSIENYVTIPERIPAQVEPPF
jgi:replicative DNA helicase